jgi:hypothetical protein
MEGGVIQRRHELPRSRRRCVKVAHQRRKLWMHWTYGAWRLRLALKLRRAEEKVVIQYSTRAASFKRLLGSVPHRVVPSSSLQ